MNAPNLILILSLFASCAWGGWTAGIWPAASTSPRLAVGTNGCVAKDFWSLNVYSSLVERASAIHGSPPPFPSFWRFERANLVGYKTWIYNACSYFVDPVTTSYGENYSVWLSTNDSFPRLTPAVILLRANLPSNYFSYTPWRALNEATNGWDGLRLLISMLKIYESAASVVDVHGKSGANTNFWDSWSATKSDAKRVYAASSITSGDARKYSSGSADPYIALYENLYSTFVMGTNPACTYSLYLRGIANFGDGFEDGVKRVWDTYGVGCGLTNLVLHYKGSAVSVVVGDSSLSTPTDPSTPTSGDPAWRGWKYYFNRTLVDYTSVYEYP
jgi:hypothetical protein